MFYNEELYRIESCTTTECHDCGIETVVKHFIVSPADCCVFESNNKEFVEDLCAALNVGRLQRIADGK